MKIIKKQKQQSTVWWISDTSHTHNTFNFSKTHKRSVFIHFEVYFMYFPHFHDAHVFYYQILKSNHSLDYVYGFPFSCFDLDFLRGRSRYTVHSVIVSLV